MKEDRQIKRHLDRLDAEEEEECVRVEDRVWALMQPGQPCYPWAATHIQEAIAQAELDDMVQMQEAATGEQISPQLEFGAEAMRIVREYWERQARSMVA